MSFLYLLLITIFSRYSKYTMEALRSMASGEQIDRQRSDRWPHHEKREPGEPGSGLKVKFDPWEDEDDFSDTEGVMEELQ